MRRQHPRWFGLFWFITVILFTAASFAAAYYLTSLLYRALHLNLPAPVIQIINSFLGLIITGSFLQLFTQYFKRQQFNTFQPLIDAMDRIAKGDFSIHLEDDENNGMLKDLTASVNKMASELSQMENMRQEFVSNVSHEIQSPLTSIRGFAQALQNDQLTLQERHHYLQIIENESKRLSRLTEDLLKLATLESDQLKFEPRPYALEKQIRSLILICEPQWSAKHIEMSADLAKVTIDADEDLLNQVWLNLLNNAIKFTPESGIIKVSLQEANDKAVFRISDNGIGIAPEDQIHIFERFYKADKSRTRTKEGSGLGLAIVKTIVDLHTGSIDVESAPGQGTTFTITLPNAIR
jgi:signal transduction histidine kinase